jgi:hypothetical protein
MGVDQMYNIGARTAITATIMMIDTITIIPFFSSSRACCGNGVGVPKGAGGWYGAGGAESRYLPQ